MPPGLTDIHCHLLPGIDDGATDLPASLAMAKMAADDGIQTITVTPHQLGNFAHNRGDDIRALTAALQDQITTAGIPLSILPGADVRIEDGMLDGLLAGDVLTLGDHRKHVLLELPHETYFPLEGLLAELKRHGIVGILSHPERNRGLLHAPELLPELVDAGCLMQVTAGSLVGTFGADSQRLGQWMIQHGLVHFIATDAHGPRNRRPLLSRAYGKVAELAGVATARALCCENPARVAAGVNVPSGRVAGAKVGRQQRGWRRLFGFRRAA